MSSGGGTGASFTLRPGHPEARWSPWGRSPIGPTVHRAGRPSPLRALLALAEAEGAVPNADQVAGAERGGAVDALAVEEGAAGGVGVGEDVAAALAHDAGVLLLDAAVAE